MTTEEVANRLVELCRQDKIDECLAELFAADAKSIEASDAMGPPVTEGLEGIKAKSAMFQSAVEEFHSAQISDPIVAGNSFALTWVLDVTMKGRGRVTMEEVCVYMVKDGKINLEQFFY